MLSELTIVVSREAQLHHLRLLCRDLRAESPSLELHCVCPPGILSAVEDAAGAPVRVERVPDGMWARVRRRLHTLLLLLFASEKFSPFFRMKVQSTLRKWRLKSIVVGVGRLVTPKLGGPQLNELLFRILSPLPGGAAFPTRRVVVLTNCLVPHLLCTRKHEVFTIIDGWDHPSAVPVGYKSTVIAAWNDDLAEDWHRYQGGCTATSGYPYRFDYLIRGGGLAAPSPRRVTAEIKVVYAMATFPTKSRLDKTRHQEEIEVVRRLFSWLRPQIGSFEVKPHPIGPAGHLDLLSEEFPGITVHTYETSGASTYDLSDKYNRTRIATLEHCDVVLGIWTTFLLDAALAGKGIALVHFSPETPFEALRTAQAGLHVHHLHRRVRAVVKFGPDGPSFGRGHGGIGSFVDEAVIGGREVARWVAPNRSPRDLVRDLLASLA